MNLRSWRQATQKRYAHRKGWCDAGFHGQTLREFGDHLKFPILVQVHPGNHHLEIVIDTRRRPRGSPKVVLECKYIRKGGAKKVPVIRKHQLIQADTLRRG